MSETERIREIERRERALAERERALEERNRRKPTPDGVVVLEVPIKGKG